MAEIALHFEADKDADLDHAVESIRKQLSALEAVGDVDADPEKPRLTGLEIAGAVAVTIQVVQGGRKLVTELRKLIPEIKRLITEIKGLRNVTVEVGPSRVAIADLTDAHLERLAESQSDEEQDRPAKPQTRRRGRKATS